MFVVKRKTGGQKGIRKRWCQIHSQSLFTRCGRWIDAFLKCSTVPSWFSWMDPKRERVRSKGLTKGNELGSHKGSQNEQNAAKRRLKRAKELPKVSLEDHVRTNERPNNKTNGTHLLFEFNQKTFSKLFTKKGFWKHMVNQSQTTPKRETMSTPQFDK